MSPLEHSWKYFKRAFATSRGLPSSRSTLNSSCSDSNISTMKEEALGLSAHLHGLTQQIAKLLLTGGAGGVEQPVQDLLSQCLRTICIRKIMPWGYNSLLNEVPRLFLHSRGHPTRHLSPCSMQSTASEWRLMHRKMRLVQGLAVCWRKRQPPKRMWRLGEKSERSAGPSEPDGLRQRS
jgi:hypothetical protein